MFHTAWNYRIREYWWALLHMQHACCYLYDSRANTTDEERTAAMQAAVIISDARKLVGGAA